MHYEGPGDVVGAREGEAYGYDVRVAGRSSADPPQPAAAAYGAV